MSTSSNSNLPNICLLSSYEVTNVKTKESLSVVAMINIMFNGNSREKR